MNLKRLRFVLAVLALLSIIAFAAGVLYYQGEISTVKVALLAPLASALIAECKAASSFIFDGVPDKSTPASTPATADPVSTTSPQP